MGAVVLTTGTLTYIGLTTWRYEHNSIPVAVQATIPPEGEAEPVNPFAGGDYLLAFVLVSSDCGWSSQPSTMGAIGEVRASLLAKYGADFAKIRVVGVSLDDDLRAGLTFLDELGGGEAGSVFDEISVGGSWLNEQIVKFVWQKEMAPPALPQILVMSRPVDTGRYLEDATISVYDDHVLTNPVGLAEITRWVEIGTPLDWTPYRGGPSEVSSPERP